jgi:hypothetical protein
VRKKQKVGFEVPDSSLMRYGTILTGIRRRSAGEKYCLHFWDQTLKETSLDFSKLYYLFQDPIVIFQVPRCNRTKMSFKYSNSYYFSDYLWLLFSSILLLLTLILYFLQDVPFALCWKNHLGLIHFAYHFL